MRHGPAGEQSILAFLDVEHDVVRLRAAVLALDNGLANAAPAAVLREISARRDWFGTLALARLAIWQAERDGELTPPAHRRARMAERP